jgi:hypothetical protein
MHHRTALAAAAAALALAALPASAAASGAEIEVQDVCDPVSFNAALGDGACVRPAGDGGGSVAFDELFARLERRREHGAWRFKGDKVVRDGEALRVSMTRGGEFHTFTEVAAFGLGCVPPLNAAVFPGQDPTAFPAQCADPLTFAPGAAVPGGTGILPGQSFTITGLQKGTHRFVCLIHPWMKSTVTVR